MKYLIVNGDDFGASPGVNRGILEAHRRGILTSASLFVDRPASREAVELSRQAPALSVGLHADLDGTRRHDAYGELVRQLARFRELVGRPPTHLDSHHNVHRESDVSSIVLAIGREHQLPVRAFSPAGYLSEFYGSGGPDAISVDRLIALLRTQVADGITELGCHPGHVDEALVSSYLVERERELEALCDPRVRAAIEDAGIVLVTFADLGAITAALAAGRPFERPRWRP